MLVNLLYISFGVIKIYIYIYIIMVYIYVCISSIIQEKGEDIGLAIVSRNVNGKSFAQLRINIEWLYLE